MPLMIDVLTEDHGIIEQVDPTQNKKFCRLDDQIYMIGNPPGEHIYAFVGEDPDPQQPYAGEFKKKPVTGFVRREDFDALNIETVPIPSTFAGLEAEMVPTRLMGQLFRIVEVVENEDYVEVTARHVWYDNLKNYTLWEVDKEHKDTDYTAAAVCRNVLTNAISKVGSHVASDCTDTKKGAEFDYKNKNLVECFLDPEKGICAKFGLSLIRYNWDFYCLKEVGYDRGFVVENGKNLLGVERTESIENLVTRVAPIGKDDKGDIVWLDYNGKKYVDSQYIGDYSYPHVEIYDTGLKIGDGGVTQQNIQEKLLEAGRKRFTDDKVDLPEVEMTIEFISLGDTEEYRQYRGLDKVYLYDILTIHDTVRGYSYTAQVVGVEHDILTGMLNSVTIGKLDNWDGTRKIATWQVPQVDGGNIRFRSIQQGAFVEGAIQAQDIGEAVISYVHIAEATIDSLTADSIEAVTAQIHEIIAGSITADDITAGSITTETLAAGAITAEKIAAEAITTDKLEAGAVTAGKIAAGAITTEKLDAYAVTAAKIAADAVTADKISAGAISASKIDTTDLSAINATLGTANIADARIAIADINYAQVKDLNAQSAYFGQAVIQEGLANKLFIPRLSVVYAQIVSATISDLVIQATNDNFYKLDVDLSGNVTATQITPSSQEIEQGHTADGRTIYLGTDIVAEDLNTTNIYASHALMDEITANIINVDQLFAREATIGKINAMDLSSNTYIQATIGNWQSGSTITQTISSISSRISSLGYGTIYYSATEPSHEHLVQGDIWVQPLDDHIWGDYDQNEWEEILNGGTWGSVLGAYKVYTWTGQYFKVLFDSTVNTEMWTAIEQNSAAITLKASQEQVNLLSGQVTDFEATLDIQSQEISSAVSAVNTKASSYVMWADPRTAYTVTLGDIWIKCQEDFGRWLETKESTWGHLKDTYDWKDALGGETKVWDGHDWVTTSDRASEIYQKTLIDQTSTQVAIIAETTAELSGDLYAMSAQLTVANDRISAEVSRATTAEGGKLDKTSQYQTADSIVSAAESWVGEKLQDQSWVSQTATGITAYVASYVGNNAYTIKSGIEIKAAGIEISGAKYIKIKSGGSFSVDSGNFSIDTSGNVTLTGTITATSITANTGGNIAGWTISANRLSSGTGTKYVGIDSSANIDYAFWAGNSDPASAKFWVKKDGTAKFAGTISAAAGSSMGGWTLGSDKLYSGSGNSYVAIASSGTYSMWAGHGTDASAPFRLKPDGTVYLTKLIAVAEDQSETEVNLRTAGLWKLNYTVIKSVTTTGGYVSSMSLSDGTTVNFNRAAAVSLSGSWGGTGGRTFTVTEASSGKHYSETPTYETGKGTSVQFDSITVDQFNSSHLAYARVKQSSGQGGNVLFGFKIDASGQYNGGWGAAADGCGASRSGNVISGKYPTTTVGTQANFSYTVTADYAQDGVAKYNCYAKIGSTIVDTKVLNINDRLTERYNAGYNQAIADATLVTRYTRTATPYGGNTTHYYKDGNNYISCGNGWYQTSQANAYTLPTPK